jgi:hypothetical protein
MTPNAFIGWTAEPTDADLASVLGPAKALWDRIVENTTADLSLTAAEWKSYSVKHGWSLRLKKGKRNILYLVPFQGSVEVMFILGDKAVAAARAGKLSQKAAKLIDDAPRYPEGTGIRIEIRSARDLSFVFTLAKIKAEH